MSTDVAVPAAGKRKRGRPKKPPGESWRGRLQILREAEQARKRAALVDAQPDLNRCWGWDRSGSGHGRCALDKGHYRSMLDGEPSPHVSETGMEWF